MLQWFPIAIKTYSSSLPCAVTSFITYLVLDNVSKLLPSHPQVAVKCHSFCSLHNPSSLLVQGFDQVISTAWNVFFCHLFLCVWKYPFLSLKSQPESHLLRDLPFQIIIDSNSHLYFITFLFSLDCHPVCSLYHLSQFVIFKFICLLVF